MRAREKREHNTTYELTDAPPSSSDPASRWVPYFAPDEPDKPRTTFEQHLPIDNPTNARATAATTSAHATCAARPASLTRRRQRQCYTGKYKDATVSGSEAVPTSTVRRQPSRRLTNVASTINSAIDALVAKGSTVIPAGLLWGWRVISPTPPFTDGADYANDKVTKAIVLLTDGENDVNGGSNGYQQVGLQRLRLCQERPSRLDERQQCRLDARHQDADGLQRHQECESKQSRAALHHRSRRHIGEPDIAHQLREHRRSRKQAVLQLADLPAARERSSRISPKA